MIDIEGTKIMTSNRTLSKISSVILLLFAAAMLFMAQSSYWINHTLFNQTTFSQITSQAILEESSRDAVATALVDKALADRPVLMRTVGERVTSFVSGLLGSDLSAQLIKTLSSKTYAYITASNREDIAINLEGIKAPLAGMVDLAQSAGRGERLESIEEKLPNEIVLAKSSDFPDLSRTVQVMLWLGPLFWLASLLSFAGYIYMGRRDYARRVYWVGGTIAAVALLGIVTAPFIPAPVAAAMPNINLRPVAINLANGFLQPFIAQMYWMLGITLLALLIFNQRFHLLMLLRSLESSLSNSAAKRSSKPRGVDDAK